MIKKEDFNKRFPITVMGCVVDFTVSDKCVIDEGKEYNCVMARDISCKEECKYWKELPNWDYISDIWKWINNYQKKEGR